jgi:replicative DNA helicase
MTSLDTQLPPHDIELELSILSACFIGGQEALSEAVDLIDAEYFYNKSHKVIFDAIVDVSNEAESADSVSVASMLKSKGKLGDAGGIVYVSKILDVPPSVDVEYSCKRLEQMFLLRRTIEKCFATIKRCHSGGHQFDDVINFFLESAHSVCDGSKAGDPVAGMKQMAMNASDIYDERYRNKKIVTGVPTGINDLDEILFGLHDGDLTLLAARPGMGKTALALNIAKNAALLGYGTLIESLEMPKEQLFDRLVAAESRIDGKRIRIGNFTKTEFSKVNECIGRLYDLPIYVDDRGGLQLQDLIKTVRRQVKLHPDISLVIIDHIQLVRGNDAHGRNVEVGNTSAALKALAKEIKRPILALSQLNRELERRNNPYKRPKLSDLRDSGSLEQDADNVVFIYRPWVYGDDIDPKDAQTQIQINESDCELIVAKQRNGPTGMAECQFFDSIQLFVGNTKISPDELYQEKIKERDSNGEKDKTAVGIRGLQTGPKIQ